MHCSDSQLEVHFHRLQFIFFQQLQSSIFCKHEILNCTKYHMKVHIFEQNCPWVFQTIFPPKSTYFNSCTFFQHYLSRYGPSHSFLQMLWQTGISFPRSQFLNGFFYFSFFIFFFWFVFCFLFLFFVFCFCQLWILNI